MQAIHPISGRVPFRRVGPIRPTRPIGEPWRDGNGARSDDDREELGGAERWVSSEVAARAGRLNAEARANRAAARPSRKPDHRSGTETRAPETPPRAPRRGPVRPPPQRPGAVAFHGGSGADAVLAYGDAVQAWTRLMHQP